MTDIGIIQAPTRSDPIEDDSHLKAGAGSFTEGVAEFFADLIGIKNESLKVDRFARAPDSVKHGRKIFVTVLQKIDPVTSQEHRITEGESRAYKLGAVHVESVLEMIINRVPADDEETKEENDREEAEG